MRGRMLLMNRNIQRRDLEGQKFNRLTAIRPDVNRHGRTYWICRCECGKEKSISTTCLSREKTQSCGCALVDFLKSRATHRATCVGSAGHRNRTPEYSAWSSLKNRCRSPQSKYYDRYGGRGIHICDRWAESFADFLADMGPRPSPEHSIDRIDNDGNYEPDNCRWATRKEQTRNRRSNRLLLAFGQSLTIAEWAERNGVRPPAIRQRLRIGWSNEDAVSIPSRHYSQSSVSATYVTAPTTTAKVAHHHGDTALPEPGPESWPTVRATREYSDL